MSKFVGMDAVPVIDIGPFLSGDPAGARAVAEAVREACEGIGFFTVTGHRVPESTIDRLYSDARVFFGLPLDEKLRIRKPEGTYSKGYTAMGVKTVGKDRNPDLRPSLHESYAIGQLDATDDPYYRCEAAGTNFSPNLWPERPTDLKPAMTAYYREMERLSGAILAIFAHILDVPVAYFADRLDRHISILRLMHYPDLARQAEPGEERAGAHTDTTAITILRVDDSPGGLQVRTPDGRWIDVARIPQAFIINIGDIMMRWTNDRFVSTMHRVVNPPTFGGGTGRISIPYFCMPNYDAVIECIPSCVGQRAKYPPVTSGELLAKRYTVTYSVNKAAAG
jgi:isopenicillin N synthase-like dioxygenase